MIEGYGGDRGIEVFKYKRKFFLKGNYLKIQMFKGN